MCGLPSKAINLPARQEDPLSRTLCENNLQTSGRKQWMHPSCIHQPPSRGARSLPGERQRNQREEKRQKPGQEGNEERASFPERGGRIPGGGARRPRAPWRPCSVISCCGVWPDFESSTNDQRGEKRLGVTKFHFPRTNGVWRTAWVGYGVTRRPE